MPVNEIVQSILQAAQIGSGIRTQRDQERERQANIENLLNQLEQRRQLFPGQLRGQELGLQGAEFGIQESLANILSKTTGGGQITLPGQEEPLDIEGLTGQRQAQVSQAGAVAEAQTAGQLKAQIDAFNKVDENEVAKIKARLHEVGIEPGDPRYSATLSAAFKLPQTIPLSAIDPDMAKELGVDIPIDLEKALDRKARIKQAQVAGQARITVAGMRGTGGLSPAQETAVADMNTGLSELRGIQDIFSKAKSKLGPIAGRSREMLRGQGVAVDKDFNLLAVKVAQFRNKLLKIRSGAAVTDNELRRIAEELPNVSDSPQDFEIKLRAAMEDLERAISNLQQSSGGAGSSVIVQPSNYNPNLFPEE